MLLPMRQHLARGSLMTLIDQIKHARRVSVPLVAIQTPDPAATMRSVAESLNNGQAVPVVAWDVVRGTWPVNDAGQAVAALTGNGDEDDTIGSPVELLRVAGAKFPARTVAFLCNAQEWLDMPPVRQAIWNLRDEFKCNQRMLILLGPTIELPPSLTDDVVILDESLPAAEELAKIVAEQDEAACVCAVCAGKGICGKCGGEGVFGGLECASCKGEKHCQSCGGSGRNDHPQADEETTSRAVAAVRGLSAFAAEQATAMSLRPDGIDLDHLWESKRRQIEQTPGLSVWRGTETFADVGGLDFAKQFLRQVLGGSRRYNAVVWLDELEKMVAGAEGVLADSSGVSQGILQAILGHMQDHQARGLIFVGPPGTGKSLLAKATGGEAGVPTIAWDSNAMKGSLVGQSEGNVRTALQVVSAVSDDATLWIATCNSVRGIPTALRRRFGYGTYFVDLPNKAERQSIWKRYLPISKKMTIDLTKVVHLGHDWTGAEIRTCCELSGDLDCTVWEAAKYLVPVARSMPDEIEKLRNEAEGRYLSASYPSVYRRGGPDAKGSRTIEVE